MIFVNGTVCSVWILTEYLFLKLVLGYTLLVAFYIANLEVVNASLGFPWQTCRGPIDTTKIGD